MKKISRILLSALIAAVMCFSLTACGPDAPVEPNDPVAPTGDNMLRDNDFAGDPDRRPSREPFVDNTPEDTGTLADNYFEFESARYTGSSNNADHRCVAKSFEFNAGFGGNICMKNIGGGASMTFTFNSDKAVRSPMLIRLSTAYAAGSSIGSVYSITVNDNAVVDTTVTVPTEGEIPAGANSYFSMATLETKVSLAAGKNELTFTASTASCPNIDYIDIRTSATLTDSTAGNWPRASEFASVTKVPTDTQTGTVAFSCPVDGCPNAPLARTLPALSHEKYRVEENATSASYYIGVGGDEFKVAETFALTLQGATFADGTSSKKVAAGATPDLRYTVPDGKRLAYWYNVDDESEHFAPPFTMTAKAVTVAPYFEIAAKHTLTLVGAAFADDTTSKTVTADSVHELKVTAPAGRTLVGWYDCADKSNYYAGASFTMPDRDITIAPVFDAEAYAPLDGSAEGKVQMHNGGYLRVVKQGSTVSPDGDVVLREVDKLAEAAARGVVGDELGMVYNFTGVSGGELPAGWYFTPLSTYKVVSANAYTMVCTVENQGTEAVSLKLHQVNAGGAPLVGQATSRINLAPGAAKTVNIPFTGYDNASVMTTVELLNAAASVKIGMYQCVRYGTIEPEPAPTFTLTLQGAELAAGGTSGAFAEDAEPEIVVVAPAGRKHVGWYNVNAKNEYYAGTGFAMPAKNITIAPAFDVDAYAPADGSAGGKLTPGDVTVESGVVADPFAEGVVSADGEVGTVYTLKGVGGADIPAETGFTVATPFAFVATHTYTAAYTLANCGDAAVTLRICQTKTAGVVADVSDELTLAAGEVKTVTLVFAGYTGDSWLTTVRTVGAAASLKLGLFCTFTFEADTTQRYELTLAGGATFAGGGTTAQCAMGDTPDIEVAVPAGKTLVGWRNAAGSDVYLFDENATRFTMPAKALTIAPVFDAAEYAPFDGAADGKLQLYPKNGLGTLEDRTPTGYIRAAGAGAVAAAEPYWGVVGNELGAVYSYKGEGSGDIPAGWYFTPMSPYKVTSDKQYKISYTLENFGSATLRLRLFQTNSGYTVKPADMCTEFFTLAPGEVRTLALVFAGDNDNDNVMTTIEVVDSVPALKLGLYEYFETYTETAPAEHTLTLSGATFADAQTSKVVAAGTELSDLAVAPPQGKKLVGWREVGGVSASSIVYFAGAAFKMPRRDLTIAPVYDVEAYAPRAEDGKLGMGSVRADKMDVTNVTAATKLETGIIADEICAVYTCAGKNGAIPANWFFMMQSAVHDLGATDSYRVTFRVHNRGVQAVELKIYETTASNNPKPADSCGEAFTLAAGEVKTVAVDISFGVAKTSLLTTIELLSADVSYLDFGMCMYIETTTPAQT